ncbi:MAG: hypothetical protein HDR24_05960 [Lachnospiraceae bacterium]|nr:hypothetical protein [Lachnospiraceae bacterium]
MKYLLWIYLREAQKRRKKYDLIADNVRIENWDMIHPGSCTQYYIAGYGKKRNMLFEGYFDLRSMICISDKIRKSSFVIIRSKRFCRNDALNMLREYSYRERCFAPIIYSSSEEILFFPQLRHQDCLLIRWLLKQQFKEETYYVTYANRNGLIAI